MSIIFGCALPHPPLIIPSVGRGQEKTIPATVASYQQVARLIVEAQPETLVITSPHAPCYRDALYVSAAASATGSMAQFASAETVAATYDVALSERIAQLAAGAGIPVVHGGPEDAELDHATFIPLWFIRQACQEAGVACDFKIVRIGISGLPFATHATMGGCIAQAVGQLGRKVVFVASGDCSHYLREDGPYGFRPQGPKLDARLCEIFAEGRLMQLLDLDPALCNQAGECGVRSFQMLAAALHETGTPWKSQLLSYEGPLGVGYLSALLTRDAGAAEGDAPGQPEVDPVVAFARACVEHSVRTGQQYRAHAQDGFAVPPELQDAQAGAFVSIHKLGQLRGCMGTICATQDNLATEIAYCARMASVEDPRFDPIQPDELDFLELSVDVLEPAEDIPDESLLDPAHYGVIVTKGWRRGLLLPNLEGVDTVRDQVDIAKRKAGIGLDEDGVQLQRFKVVRHDRGGQARRG